jgi:tRNA threonylcarbamoyladenosine biosynthesis protein TsaB
MILCIKTNTPIAELYLYDATGHCLSGKTWPAHKKLAETFHTTLTEQLASLRKSLTDITGIVVYNGDGSFTGLRIGISVANALAYALDVPVVDGTADSWVQDGIKKVVTAPRNHYVITKYDAPVFVTAQKK